MYMYTHVYIYLYIWIYIYVLFVKYVNLQIANTPYISVFLTHVCTRKCVRLWLLLWRCKTSACACEYVCKYVSVLRSTTGMAPRPQRPSHGSGSANRAWGFEPRCPSTPTCLHTLTVTCVCSCHFVHTYVGQCPSIGIHINIDLCVDMLRAKYRDTYIHMNILNIYIYIHLYIYIYKYLHINQQI